jgi:anti-sigma-K factor RskA
MKPCAKNRKLIAWLALDALDALDTRSAQVLREHLAACEGCRRYLAEISSVTAKLSAAEPASDIQASATFHQKVADRLKANEPNSVWEIVIANLTRVNWRIAIPAVAALVMAVVALTVPWQQPAVPPHHQLVAQIVTAPDLYQDLSPTFANYQRVANESLEKLDELLTEQGNRNLSPTPIYTASTRSQANGSF